MKKITFFIILFFFVNILFSQKSKIYYSSYAEKTQKDHTSSLVSFITDVSKKNAIGIIDGYNIEFNKEIKISNLNNIEILVKNTRFYSNHRFSGFFINFVNVSNIIIDGVNIEMLNSNPVIYSENDYPNVYNGALGFRECKNIMVKNSQFSNLYTRSIEILESSGEIFLNNNLFSSKKQNQKFLLEHIVLGSCRNAAILVNKNKFNNEPYDNPDYGISSITGFGLGKGAGKVQILDNLINFSGRSNAGKHRLYAIDFYDDCDNLNIEGNTLENVMWGAVRFNGSSENVNIANNQINVKRPDETGVITSSTTKNNPYFRNIKIFNNTITSSINLSSAILLQNQYENIQTKNVFIESNKINNFYYNISLRGYWDDLSINNNIIKGDYSAIGISFILKNKRSIEQIKVLNNNINAYNTGVSLNSEDNKLNNTAFMIKNNEIYSLNKSEKGYGVIVNIGLKGEIIIENNQISGFNNAMYIRENTVSSHSNKFVNNKNNLLKDQ